MARSYLTRLIIPVAVIVLSFAGYAQEFVCQPNSLFSQEPQNPSTYFISDNETTDFDTRRFERYTGSDGSGIDGITFWGVIMHKVNQASCFNGGSVNFEISFFSDNSGQIGGLEKSFLVSITPSTTSLSISGITVLRFDAALPELVPLASGWVSVARDNPAEPECVFAWLNTENGDGSHSWKEDGGKYYTSGNNLSFCLTGRELPPDYVGVPLASWALALAIFLITVAAALRFRRMA